MLNDNQQQVESTIQNILEQFRSGDTQGALAAAEKARDTYPGHADLYHVSSKMLEALNTPAAALEMMESATQQPDAHPKYLLELAEMYERHGRSNDAERSCKAYLEATPEVIPGLLTLAQVYENRGDFSTAEDKLRQAVDAAGDDVESKTVRLNELGTRLRRMGKPEDAVEVFRQAIELTPAPPGLHYNIGNALMDSGAPDDAIKHYNTVLDRVPDHAEAHLHLGFAYLTKGNLRRGWREMEWRWNIPVFAKTALPSPRWKGEKIDGTVLLLSEQGLGDSVHFIRYAAEVSERCSKVIVYCPASLARLMKTAQGVDEVATWNEPIPEHDAYVPMMSLPQVFRTELDTIPNAVPYLSAETADIEAWAEKLGSLPGPKIGLAWSGNPQNLRERMRAIPTAAALELIKGIDANVICLQKDRPTDIEDWPDNLHHFGDDFEDVSEAAALMENLDLVLSIDTLSTHLAGALNKELWTLLAPAADWRYLLEREDSPWYPSARLVRRTNDEDWSAFMDRVLGELKARFPDV
ncbi:tetratricopeptide repeat protein [Pseudomonadota bacterium]